MDNIGIISESGFTKPCTKLDVTHKKQLIHCVCLHNVILVSLAELSQFRDGIHKIAGIKDMMCMHSNLLESFYCMNRQGILTSGG